MLAVFLFWIFILLVAWLYGLLTVCILQALFQVKAARPVSFPLVFLCGLASLTTLAAGYSLVYPLGRNAAVLMASGAVVILGWTILFQRREWSTLWSGVKGVHPAAWLVLAAAAAATLIVSTLKPANPDTGLYHAQAIRWIETFRAVPGLGNLHGRLAYNSNWLVVNALFSLAFLKLHSFHLVGSATFLVSLIFLAQGIQQLLHRRPSASALIKTLLFPISFYVLASEVSSPGTDLPVTLLTWVILILWVERIEKGQQGWDLEAAIISMFCLFAVAVKLAALPLLVLPAAWWLQSLGKRRLRQAAGLAALALIMLAPWLLRNIILSGCLVYPEAFTCIFQSDWRMPPGAVQAEQEWITSWARIPGMPKEQVLAMPVWQWAVVWFNELTRNRQVLMVVLAAAPLLLALASGLARLLGVGMAERLKSAWYPYRWLAAFALGGLLFWFFTGPRLRFGNGLLMFSFAGVVLLLLNLAGVRSPARSRWLPALIAAGLVFYSGYTLVESLELQTLKDRLILPADYVSLPTAPCMFKGVAIACATQYQQCGYEPFPCAPDGNPAVEMRGPSFQDGFRWGVGGG